MADPRERAERQRYYDQHLRDPQRAAFYHSPAWLAVRQLALERDHYLCQSCLRRTRLTPADLVHHKEPLEKRPDLALILENLESSCNSCHNKEHPEKGQARAKREPERKRRAKVIVSKANEEIV